MIGTGPGKKQRGLSETLWLFDSPPAQDASPKEICPCWPDGQHPMVCGPGAFVCPSGHPFPNKA